MVSARGVRTMMGFRLERDRHSRSGHAAAANVPAVAQVSIRPAFVDRFGETTAEAIEKAADSHATGRDSKGSDPFKWALQFTIGYDCFTKYRDAHNFPDSASSEDLQQWIKDYANLKDFDGDWDAISLLAGSFEPYGVPYPSLD